MWVKIAGAWTDVGPAGDLSAYAQKAAANTFTEDQTIEHGNYIRAGDGATGGLSGFHVHWTRNAKYDGANWVRLIADNDASYLAQETNGDLVYWVNSDAGTTVGSIITWVEKFRISRQGHLTNTGWAWGKQGVYFESTGLRGVTGGTGSPEGVVSAYVGSLYTRTDGGAGTTFYVKESGTGNTGWKAIGGGGMKLLASAILGENTASTNLTAPSAFGALDTTNLRVTFTAPSSGKVRLRCHYPIAGNNVGVVTSGGATVYRASGFYHGTYDSSSTANINIDQIIDGLTPGASYTWDLAGDNSANYPHGQSYGALSIEVWDVG